MEKQSVTSKYSEKFFVHDAKLLNFNNIRQEILSITYMYICNVDVSSNSANVSFICDDPGTTFDCRLNNRRIQPYVYN